MSIFRTNLGGLRRKSFGQNLPLSKGFGRGFQYHNQGSQRTARFIASDPALSKNVHIPKVYDEFTTKRVMTAEWISGIRLSDRAGVSLLMGESKNIVVSQANVPLSVSSSPDDPPPISFPIPSTPLRGGVRSVMQIMVELFSAQMFSWGYIHCDPHPGIQRFSLLNLLHLLISLAQGTLLFGQIHRIQLLRSLFFWIMASMSKSMRNSVEIGHSYGRVFSSKITNLWREPQESGVWGSQTCLRALRWLSQYG